MPGPETTSLTIEAEALRPLEAAVAKGDFASTGEALRDAVLLWERERLKDAARLLAIRDKLRRSLDDPRPDIDDDEVERHLAHLHAETVEAHGSAKA